MAHSSVLACHFVLRLYGASLMCSMLFELPADPL
jgi:hypothetical protein